MTTYNEDDISPEEQDRLEAMGTPITTRPSPFKGLELGETWSHLLAMERSHTWKVYRGVPSTRNCTACGDSLDSTVRYCPGSSSTDHTRGDE